MSARPRVAVLFGGKSVEREVSRISARTIAASLDPAKYEVDPARGRARTDGSCRRADSAKLLSAGRGAGAVPRGRRRAGKALVPAEIAPGRVDVVFPIIHGTTGEDGALQGFLETLGVPYVGRRRDGLGRRHGQGGLQGASARRRDSDAAGRRRARGAEAPRAAALAAAGLRQAGQRRLVGRRDEGQAPRRISPPRSTLALRYDERALVEEGIDARELECAVLGNDEPRASIPGEIVPGHEFYDYDDKYRDDKAKLLIPAPVSAGVADEARRLAVAVFRLCGVSGMARVDFFLERGTDRVLVNEINTLPGFTAISMYPKLWEASGLPLAGPARRAHPPRPRAARAPRPPADEAPGRAGVAPASRGPQPPKAWTFSRTNCSKARGGRPRISSTSSVTADPLAAPSPLEVPGVEVDQGVGQPLRHARGDQGLAGVFGRHVHEADRPARDHRDLAGAPRARDCASGPVSV